MTGTCQFGGGALAGPVGTVHAGNNGVALYPHPVRAYIRALFHRGMCHWTLGEAAVAHNEVHSIKDHSWLQQIHL